MADQSMGMGEFLSKIRVIVDNLPYALASNCFISCSISVLHISSMGFHRFHRFLGGSLTAALALLGSPAGAEELRDWSFNPANSELTFSLADTVFPEFFLLSEPPRLVLDIPATELGAVDPQQTYGGVVQTIRVAQHTSEQVRVVIELSPDIVLEPEQADIQFDEGENGQRRDQHNCTRPVPARCEFAGNKCPGFGASHT